MVTGSKMIKLAVCQYMYSILINGVNFVENQIKDFKTICVHLSHKYSKKYMINGNICSKIVLTASHLVEMPVICHTQWNPEVEYSSIFFLFLLLGVILTQNPLDASLASLSNFFYGLSKNYLSGHKTLHF